MTWLQEQFMEPGKRHTQVYLDVPGLCPTCLSFWITGRRRGGKTQLVPEEIDGVKTGKWICPFGGKSYREQGGVPPWWP
jgi:hypothetical protein